MPTIEISLVSHLVSEVVIKLSTDKQLSKQTDPTVRREVTLLE